MTAVADLVEYDWLTAHGTDLLHYATPEALELDLDDSETTWDDVRFVCGQRVEWACIPGVFTRMSTRRCAACCATQGLPRGKGSPKNDPACRALLGLDQKVESTP